ncbi:MAG: hypothetical protein ACSLFE_08290 [Gemmatimonadaceae bacterium]
MNVGNVTVNVALTIDATIVPMWRVRALGWFARLLRVPMDVVRTQSLPRQGA